MNRQLYFDLLALLNDEWPRAASGLNAETGSRPNEARLAETSSDADVDWTTILNLRSTVVTVTSYLAWSAALFMFFVGEQTDTSYELMNETENSEYEMS